MKNLSIITLALIAGTLVAIRIYAAEEHSAQKEEYATIRWDGKDRTHLIRPGGQVEFIGTELKKFEKPERADDRAFYMNAAMNGLSREGYEFAGMTGDVIVMKRKTEK